MLALAHGEFLFDDGALSRVFRLVSPAGRISTLVTLGGSLSRSLWAAARSTHCKFRRIRSGRDRRIRRSPYSAVPRPLTILPGELRTAGACVWEHDLKPARVSEDESTAIGLDQCASQRQPESGGARRRDAVLEDFLAQL